MGKDGKPKGRMSSYAYFVQTYREEHKKKFPNQNVVFAEFSKKCAQRWKTMTEKEKNRFLVMAEKDKKRYDGEMADYEPPKGQKGGRKRKRTKDPNAPKRALSAFFWFCNDERPRVKAVMSDATVGQVAKELGRRWNECTEDQKCKYEALTAKDKARYEKAMVAYKANKDRAPAAALPKREVSDEEEDEEEEDEEEEYDDE